MGGLKFQVSEAKRLLAEAELNKPALTSLVHEIGVKMKVASGILS